MLMRKIVEAAERLGHNPNTAIMLSMQDVSPWIHLKLKLTKTIVISAGSEDCQSPHSAIGNSVDIAENSWMKTRQLVGAAQIGTSHCPHTAMSISDQNVRSFSKKRKLLEGWQPNILQLARTIVTSAGSEDCQSPHSAIGLSADIAETLWILVRNLVRAATKRRVQGLHTAIRLSMQNVRSSMKNGKKKMLLKPLLRQKLIKTIVTSAGLEDCQSQNSAIRLIADSAVNSWMLMRKIVEAAERLSHNPNTAIRISMQDVLPWIHLKS